jgi:hypothetical protein
MDRFQSGINIQPKKNSFFKGFSANLSYSNYDSLFDAGSKAFDMEEFFFDQSLALSLSENVTFNVETNLNYWKDQISLKTEKINSWKSSLLVQDDYSFLFQLGNFEQGLSINSKMNESSITFNTFRTNLRGAGYNYTFANSGVGFSLLNNLEDRIINNSDFINFYSGLNFRKQIKTTWLTFSGILNLKHYWNLSYLDVQYEYNPNSLILNSNLDYSDIKNIGLISSSFTASGFLLPSLLSRTMLSSNANIYGSSTFKEEYKGVPTWNISQSLKYMLDENAFFELFFSYLPARRINDFTELENSSNWPSTRVRPIKLLSGTAKVLFFDKSLAMSLSLRNLLDSVESYNTNGQYYNMSIFISASLQIGSKK